MANNNYQSPMFNTSNNSGAMVPPQSGISSSPTYSTIPTMPQVPSAQSYFPQPQGNVFMINSSSEVNSVPISNGLSAAISLNDNTMFLKTIQNGNPILVGYKLCPLETYSQPVEKPLPKAPAADNVEELLKKFEERLDAMEQSLKKKTGGKTEGWQL